MEKLEMIAKQQILGKEVTMYGTEEEPLFLAKDIANWIEHNKANEMILNVDEDEKLKAILSHSGQKREMWFLTEDGLYEVLMQSRKPIAKEFKKKIKIMLKDLRLKKLSLTNNTKDKIKDEQINQLINALNSITKSNQDTLNVLLEQNSILVSSLNNMLSTYNIQQSNNTNIEGYNCNSNSQFKNMNYDFKKVNINPNDKIENEIINDLDENLTIQDFCLYINDKQVVDKKVGIQTVNQLLKDNGIYTSDGSPYPQSNYLFNFAKIKSHTTCMLNKYGMIEVYRLIVKYVNEDYIVRKSHRRNRAI